MAVGLALTTIAFPAETRGDLSGDKQPASTKAMNARLDEIWQNSDPISNYYRYGDAVGAAEALVAQAQTLPERLQLTESPERILLYAGRTEDALDEFGTLKERVAATGMNPPPAIQRQLLMFEALCYLRLGEQQNCMHNHNADSCLFPIKDGGVHTMQEGSRTAIGLLTKILELNGDDLEARWLLNIAYMTLGEYPDEVPRNFRIDPALFESKYDIKRFPDVAPQLGLAVDDLAGGSVMDDFDHDGFLDIMTSGSGRRSQLHAFRNNGDGTFTDRTLEAGLDGVTGGLNIIQGDYNNDGFVDVLILRTGWLREDGCHPNSLLRNNGDFTFTDVTEESGLLSFHPTQTAVWFDYNGDGWLDIFIGNETANPNKPHKSELFRNNRDGTFTETSGQHRLHIAKYVKAAVAGDYNNDGRPDLYLSIIGGNNMLLENQGPATDDDSPDARWRFRDVSRQAGVAQPFMSFPAWFFDYDNDGWSDLFVSGYFINNAGDIAADYLGEPNSAETPRLYRNNGDGTFEDVTETAGLKTVLHTMGCNFGDLDNDGWLDFYAGTGDPYLRTLIPSRMFRNDGSGHFVDVTTSGGFGQLQKGHGVSFGDLDHDGDEDIYSVAGGVLPGDNYPNQLFVNPGHGNHWIKLEVEGVTSNRIAMGARIHVVAKDGGDTRSIYKTVGSGGSFGASPMRQEIGLGSATEIDRVEILWPTTGKTQTLTGLSVDHMYKVREDTDEAVEVPLKSFMLPTTGSGAHQHYYQGHDS